MIHVVSHVSFYSAETAWYQFVTADDSHNDDILNYYDEGKHCVNKDIKIIQN